MLKKTIGVFDSGMGGLTAVQELERLLPDADIVYFGDTGHIPYGGRSRSQLMYMARRNIAFLEERGAGIILAACGTVTSTVLDTLAAETATPLFGVARPAAVRAAGLTKNGVIGFIATEACIASGYNQRLISELLPGAEIVSSACPDGDVSVQRSLLNDVSRLLHEAQSAKQGLISESERVNAMTDVCAMARAFHDEIVPVMARLRSAVDELELIVDKDIWPVPTYGDLMFEV